jgi:hypothetical protein
MSKRNGKEFNMDDYSRRTLEEKARLREHENKDILRKTQKEMIEKYGKRKWLQPLGKLLIPSKMWCDVFKFPADVVTHIVNYVLLGIRYVIGGALWIYLFLVIDWRLMLGKWLHMCGVKHTMQVVRPGVVKLTVIVKGEVVEEVEVRV